MSDHLIAEANRHAEALPKMTLPTTKPNDIDYARLMREWEFLDDRNKVLERENAVLRKDKERLDLLNTLRQYYSHPPLRKVSGWAWSIVDERDERTGDIRDTIDAIKNKTENDKITYHKGPEFMASGVAAVHTF